MDETSERDIVLLIQEQKKFFATHQTKDVEFRLTQLRRLLDVVQKYEKEIENALWADLHKSSEEAYLTEVSLVLAEIKYHTKNLKRWSRTKRVPTPLFSQPSSSKIIYEPLGLSLIIAPWNYPFQLVMNPLVGAISSGCCAVLKPSPEASETAKIIEKMISETFDSAYISVVQGGKEANTVLLKEKFDIIFFTGSSRVGKIVMKAAAEHLTPVVLELGGKSPCIVGKEANIDIAAKRIIWGKLINAGQTCIAPDYVYVHASVKDQLLEKMVIHLKTMFGPDCKDSRFYPRIINDDAMSRLEGLMKDGVIYFGGETDSMERYISPTIIEGLDANHAIMQEEIFGPILPVLTFDELDEAIEFINKNDKPLAFYYFGSSERAEEVLRKTASGGVCINDALMHFVNQHLPFGGVGNSGMAKYHGKESFLAFSNRRGLVTSSTWIDLPFKYVPFKWFKWVRKIV